MSSPSGSGSSSQASDSEPDARPSSALKAKARAAQSEFDSGSDDERQHALYAPPAGFTAFKSLETAADFDWDAVADDDNLELWLIRVPEGFKAKQLESAALHAPTRKSAQLGTLARKSGQVTHVVKRVEDDDGAEELGSLRCVLPRKRKGGRLFLAPKPFAQHIVVSRAPATPTVDLGSSQPVQDASQRPSWPASALKHRFEPCGIQGVQAAAMEDSTNALRHDDEMEEDEEPAPKKDKEKKKKDKTKDADDTEKPPKKRKHAVDGPEGSAKKSKKSKVT